MLGLLDDIVDDIKKKVMFFLNLAKGKDTLFQTQQARDQLTNLMKMMIAFQEIENSARCQKFTFFFKQAMATSVLVELARAAGYTPK